MPFKQNEHYVDENGNEFDVQGTLDRAPNVAGRNNRMTIGPGSVVRGIIEFRGNSNRVIIGRNAYFAAGTVISFIQADGCNLEVGDFTTVADGTSFQFHETADIIIGKDCMLSSSCMISVSDMHPIYDIASGERANPAKDIVFSDHVWLGWRSYVGKGARIGAGSIIGTMSVVSGTIPQNVVAAGAPAQERRQGIRWERNLPR